MVTNPVVMKDSDHLAVWIYLLIHATHVVHFSIFGGKKTKINPGELIVGRSKIALALHVSDSKVQRILKLFESEQMVRQRTNRVGRIVSILKWEEYQITEHESEQQMNNQWTTSEQPLNTVLRMEEGKNEKNKIPHREEILKDQALIEKVRMNWRLTESELLEMIEAFELNLIAEGKTHKELSAYKSHFHNWGVKRFTDYSGTGNTKSKMVN